MSKNNSLPKTTFSILTKPLTHKEIQSITEKYPDEYISKIIRMSLDEMLECSLGGIEEIMSEALTDTPYLDNITYKIVGHEEKNILLIRVTGDANRVLYELELDEIEFLEDEEMFAKLESESKNNLSNENIIDLTERDIALRMNKLQKEEDKILERQYI